VLVAEHYWKPQKNGEVHPDTIAAGVDKSGKILYVGRGFHEGKVLPVKIKPRDGCAYVCLGGNDHRVNNYEALVGLDFSWEKANGGQVPPNAVPVGESATGEIQYVGRGFTDGILSLCRVQPSCGICCNDLSLLEATKKWGSSPGHYCRRGR